MSPGAVTYLLFTLTLAAVFAGIIAYYFGGDRYDRVEAPKHHMLADDVPPPRPGDGDREG